MKWKSDVTYSRFQCFTCFVLKVLLIKNRAIAQIRGSQGVPRDPFNPLTSKTFSSLQASYMFQQTEYAVFMKINPRITCPNTGLFGRISTLIPK